MNSRFTVLTCWGLFALLAFVSAMPCYATDKSVIVSGLPGVSVNARVIVTDISDRDMPGPTARGWEVLTQPLGQGFGEQVYWVRLDIDVPNRLLNVPMVLRFHPPSVRDVEFLLPDGRVLALGTEAPFNQRTLGFADLAASFVPSTNAVVIGVRLATGGRMFGSFELMTERSYYQSQAWRTALHGVFYGILLLALLVNSLNWIMTRQTIYGLYVGFVGFSLLASLIANGYLYALAFGTWPEHHGTMQLWAFTGMAGTALAFAARLLRTWVWHPWLERGAGLLALGLMLMVVPAAIWVQARPYVWEMVLATFLVYGLASMAASARNWYEKRNLQNSLVALAFMIFAVSQWVSMGAVFGLWQATPVNLGLWQIGLVIHLVLLQLALLINNRLSRWQDWQQKARLDALRIQADTEAKRSRDLQMFLERLTHEFKTPLAVIDSSVQSLGMLDQVVEPQRLQRYDRIRRSVARLNDLLMRSLVVEKNTLKHLEDKRELLELSALFEATFSEFTSSELRCNQNCVLRFDQDGQASQARPRFLRLSWQCTVPADSIVIDANAAWMLTAFYHLIDNALKYSLGEDEILLQIDQTQPADTPMVVISLSNTCDSAIVEADLPQLFEKYYRKGEQGNVPGAGIGLYSARHAIQAHGGSLTARMLKVGQIQFQINLPLARSANLTR